MARNLRQKKKTDSTYVFRMSFSLFYDTSLLDHCHATVFGYCFYNIIITYFTRSEVVGQKFYFILVIFFYILEIANEQVGHHTAAHEHLRKKVADELPDFEEGVRSSLETELETL